ncbi:MAG TPA: hypothetical protein VGF73_12965 [Chthoniobacterales bacterium]|jgi:hypothetical protein
MDSRPLESQRGRDLGAPIAAASFPIGAQRPLPRFLAALLFLCLTNCQTLRHQFVSPEPDWQSKIGQLQYRGPKTSLIGEVLIRYSKQGDFELTFSKGPGVILLTVRQDDKFVRVSGPLARGSWSGPPNETPARLRGWVSLRDLLLHAKDQPLIRQTLGRDRFTFAF